MDSLIKWDFSNQYPLREGNKILHYKSSQIDEKLKYQEQMVKTFEENVCKYIYYVSVEKEFLNRNKSVHKRNDTFDIKIEHIC